MADEPQAAGANVSIDFSHLERLVTIQDVAEMFEVEPRIVRREARKGKIPGAIKVLGKTGFDPDVVTTWTPPEGGERVSKREDGRRRYRIFLSEDEHATLSPDYEIVDPRVVSKARRAARKAAAAAGGTGAAPATAEAGAPEDPFDGFGVDEESA